VIPPGDMRMALASISPRRDAARLLQYRFEAGDLEGHSLGNLMIVAAIDLNGGDIVAALDYVAGILDARGRVLPCTTQPVVLRAHAEDREVEGQVNVARSRKVREVWLEPSNPEATPEARRAIRQADMVVLGPGSLFTSIIPNLLVRGIAEEIGAVGCPVVFVANLREQPGETEGLDLAGHVDALRTHAPDLRLSAIVAHRGTKPTGPGRPLHVEPGALEDAAESVLVTDLVDPRGGHDPRKLAVPRGRVLRPGRAALG
jgi:uncharacterized cofD-like protein